MTKKVNTVEEKDWSSYGHNRFGVRTLESLDPNYQSSEEFDLLTEDASLRTSKLGARLQLQVDHRSNIFIGTDSLKLRTSGYTNVAIGLRSLDALTDGFLNVALGLDTLGFTTGNQNTGIGTNAGLGIVTGGTNTFLGNNAGNNGSQKSDAVNSMALGNAAFTDASNKVIVGNASVTYIGGQVGWTTISDKRQKTTIKNYKHGLDFILKLRPVSFLFKSDKTKKPHSGFIAQEVEEIGIPFHGLEKPENDKGFYSLQYAEFVVPLVNAVKEQQVQIDELKEEIKNLKKS